MITAKKITNDGVELSDKKNVVRLEEAAIKLNAELVNSAGEYESSGVEIVYGESSALLVWERIQIVFVFKNTAPNAFEKSQFSSCDVLIFGNNDTEITKEIINAAVESFDPKVIIFGGKISEDLSSMLKAQTTNSVKLSQQALSDEGREVFVLE